MKVLNYTTTYFAILLLLIMSVWAAIFYYAMLDEIYDSIDDGLDNQKGLIIQKATVDSSILTKSDFEEGDYAIREIKANGVLKTKDSYIDTLMYMQNENDYEPVRLLRTVFHHKGKYYQMDVITSMVEEDDLISELLIALVWLYLGLVATILVLNNFLLKRIWRPFYSLIKQVSKFKLEDSQKFKTQTTNIDEFRLLNDSVENLIRSNIDAYNSQKHFIENAAHELQTPLAISINKLEAMAESGTIGKDELQLLASALDNLERLSRLNKSLLLLSKIENRQYGDEQHIVFNDVVKKIVNDFADLAEYKEVRIRIEESDDLVVSMNADLALVLLTNLVKNAIIHNVAGGEVLIALQKNAFRIENSGKDQSLEESRIFSRFNTELKTETSTGLGLSIVKAICDLYSFSITYKFATRHSMTLRFN